MSKQFYKLPISIAKRQDLTGADKVIYAAIVDRIGKNDDAWPSISKIAADSGTVPATVQESTNRLEQRGLLHVERRGQGSVRHYSLPAESLPETGKPDKPSGGESLPETGNEFTGNQYTSVPETGNEPDRPNNQSKPKLKISTYESQAEGLLELYGSKVKSPSLDTSSYQAKKNITKLLKDGRTKDELQKSIENYSRYCKAHRPDAEYRKNAGNFFGRESVYQQFIDWTPGEAPGSDLPAAFTPRNPTQEELDYLAGDNK